MARLSVKDLNAQRLVDNLVSMTRMAPDHRSSSKPALAAGASGHWRLQDAKARFSELVRRARSEGPQHVTVHGRDEVVVIAAEDFHRLKGEETGQLLIAALQASPFRDVEIEPRRDPAPVRDVRL
jgi:prevent-host-death family protein